MGRGELTRQAILQRAIGLASQVGLEGVTIGSLAEDLGLSKSGLFAHFKSKEALQVQILEHAAAQFVDSVVRPALGVPRGEPRLRALFENWLGWARASFQRGGCIFVAAAVELDDRPGPARDQLVRSQHDWMDCLANGFRAGIREGHFRVDADPEQFAQDVYGIALGCHHASRLMGDPQAEARARRAFEALLDTARVPGQPRITAEEPVAQG